MSATPVENDYDAIEAMLRQVAEGESAELPDMGVLPDIGVLPQHTNLAVNRTPVKEATEFAVVANWVKEQSQTPLGGSRTFTSTPTPTQSTGVLGSTGGLTNASPYSPLGMQQHSTPPVMMQTELQSESGSGRFSSRPGFTSIDRVELSGVHPLTMSQQRLMEMGTGQISPIHYSSSLLTPTAVLKQPSPQAVIPSAGLHRSHPGSERHTPTNVSPQWVPRQTETPHSRHSATSTPNLTPYFTQSMTTVQPHTGSNQWHVAAGPQAYQATGVSNTPSGTPPPLVVTAGSPSANQPSSPVRVEDLVGRMVEASKDQAGCRALQQILDAPFESEQVQLLLHEIFPQIANLMADQYGNFLIQKLLEVCPDDVRLKITASIAPRLPAVATTQHGTFAVQKLIESFRSGEEAQVALGGLATDPALLMCDTNGSHVVQKILTCLTPNERQFLFDGITLNTVAVCNDKQGCCVVQRCIEGGTRDQARQVLVAVMHNLDSIMLDPFGNYVVQFCMANIPEGADLFIKTFLGSRDSAQNHSKICSVARSKFGSPVLEAALKRSAPPFVEALIIQLCHLSTLQTIAMDSYGNYVVQTALSQAPLSVLASLISALLPLMDSIRTQQFGRKLETKLEAAIRRNNHQTPPSPAPPPESRSHRPPQANATQLSFNGPLGPQLFSPHRSVQTRPNLSGGNQQSPGGPSPSGNNGGDRRTPVSFGRPSLAPGSTTHASAPTTQHGRRLVYPETGVVVETKVLPLEDRSELHHNGLASGAIPHATFNYPPPASNGLQPRHRAGPEPVDESSAVFGTWNRPPQAEARTPPPKPVGLGNGSSNQTIAPPLTWSPNANSKPFVPGHHDY